MKKSEPLIPGLPDEIAELCLLHLPYPHQLLVRLVSCSWNRAITDSGFFISKRSLSLSLPYLFVLAYHKSTARIHWQALDPRSGRWFRLPSMPGPKAVFPTGFACTSIPSQGQLYVLGGMCSETKASVQSTIVYSTSTNQWSIASPMMTPRSFFAAGNVNGKIVAVGGGGPGCNDFITTSVECYDPRKDTWESVAKMRTGLARYDSAVIGGKMYVTEGWTWPFMFSPRGWVYDPKDDTWRGMEDGLKAGWTGVSVVLGDRLFVISEHGCPMKVYIPENDEWQYVGGERFPSETMQRPFAVCGVEGKIYVVSSGLNVVIGRVFEGQNGEMIAEWEVVAAPKSFHDFTPSSCQFLYA